MTWGTVVTSDALTLTTSWQDIQEASALLEIQPVKATDIIHIQMRVDFEATTDGDANWRILASVDGSEYDTLPIAAGQLDNATDPGRVSLTVSGYYSIKIQGQLSGGTDTATAMTVEYNIYAT